MWPFRVKRPVAANSARELAPLMAAAIEIEIDKSGVDALSEISFAFNPHKEIIVIRGSQDRPRAHGVLPDGTRIAAVKDFPTALAAVRSVCSRTRAPVEREQMIALLGLEIASVLIDEW